VGRRPVDRDERAGLQRAAPEQGADAAAVAGRVEALGAELREREERLRLALEGSGAGCWDFVPATTTYVWDDRCRELHGLAPGVPVDRALVDATVHPDDRPLVSGARRVVVARDDEAFRIEYRVLLPDGRVRWLRSLGRPVLGPDGQVVRLVGTLADVTAERVAAEEKERRDQFRDLLLGVLGHDLRSPLATIALSADLIARAGVAPPTDAHLTRIHAAVRRMSLMIRQLLDVTRLDLAGELSLAPREVDVGALCRAVVDEVTAGVDAGRVEVEVEGDATLRADPDRLFQVVANLVQNALAHGGGGATVRVVGGDEEVALAVHNGGAPIAPALLPVLFDPFVRGGGSRSGLGLGLFISQQLAALHGGEIDVTSTAEAGTTFTVRLPRT
jgi:PAS domain S-box-containing protein